MVMSVKYDSSVGVYSSVFFRATSDQPNVILGTVVSVFGKALLLTIFPHNRNPGEGRERRIGRGLGWGPEVAGRDWGGG